MDGSNCRASSRVGFTLRKCVEAQATPHSADSSWNELIRNPALTKGQPFAVYPIRLHACNLQNINHWFRLYESIQTYSVRPSFHSSCNNVIVFY